jgi:hypothetical protein
VLDFSRSGKAPNAACWTFPVQGKLQTQRVGLFPFRESSKRSVLDFSR